MAFFFLFTERDLGTRCEQQQQQELEQVADIGGAERGRPQQPDGARQNVRRVPRAQVIQRDRVRRGYREAARPAAQELIVQRQPDGGRRPRAPAVAGHQRHTADGRQSGRAHRTVLDRAARTRSGHQTPVVRVPKHRPLGAVQRHVQKRGRTVFHRKGEWQSHPLSCPVQQDVAVMLGLVTLG